MGKVVETYFNRCPWGWLLVTLSVTLAAPLPLLHGQQLSWVRQFGTAAGDAAAAVVADRLGNVFVAGGTNGALPGSAGDTDCLLARFDRSGEMVWMRQSGTSGGDFPHGMAIDTDGSLYVVGSTTGSFGGSSNGQMDLFLSKFDPDGQSLWHRQYGGDGWDEAAGVALDFHGNVYVCGYTESSLGGSNAGSWDAFIAKFNRDGSILWSRQLGSTGEDYGMCLGVGGSGDVFLGGFTSGSLGTPNVGAYDCFLAKFNDRGDLLWTKTLGTDVDDGMGGLVVAADGTVFVTGSTRGSLGGPNEGWSDVWSGRIDAEGRLLWLHQAGTAGNDVPKSICLDSSGNPVTTGYTTGDFAVPNPNWGSLDLFVAQRLSTGEPGWSFQLGTAMRDSAEAIAVDARGEVLVVGYTDGVFSATASGGDDCFLLKILFRSCDSAADVVGDGVGGNFPDGTVDGTDFIAFINSFAIGDATVDPLADISGGGDTGLEPDGTIDGTDFIFFINAFAIGC